MLQNARSEFVKKIRNRNNPTRHISVDVNIFFPHHLCPGLQCRAPPLYRPRGGPCRWAWRRARSLSQSLYCPAPPCTCTPSCKIFPRCCHNNSKERKQFTGNGDLKKLFNFVGILRRSMTKISASGSESRSNSQRHGSADPDPDPDPLQNVMDPQHCFQELCPICL